MHNELNKSFAAITEEEKEAVFAHIRNRLETMGAQNDGPIRARIFAASTLIAGAELFAEFQGKEAASEQLRRLADRIEAEQAVRH